ncbi:hypothetical protein FHL15_005011 [Xylaria flabelliformis]|uniref:Uncharacterized protein n=1 Tax=Xylaria flabelliformis TaxID=2512241 RepID=A0A553I219_9PEZI|nr:hypothetical protein FHL15_005011 [Xylaria flabelliformis]
MRKVHRPGPDPPAPRSRSDSFNRMLELEKMCKMKRIQQDQDHGSSTSTSNPPRATFPSHSANPPTPRSRRASDYPPLSHQTQIMKAVRRSAALPSLSLSIAPSPTQAMTMRSEASVEEISLTKEERAKTVTFSEPEDEGLSDNSSICQSPSWEQYGQKKKKKQPKKGADQKSTTDKEDAAIKKRSNRLTKSSRLDSFTAKPLTASDRSISAPDLGFAVQPSKMDPSLLSAGSQVALGKHLASRNELSTTAKDKPRGRGFLSGFKLQHGNVTAVQKLMDSRKAVEKVTGKSADENEPLRSIQYETLPIQQSNAARTASDQITSRSRKPPSIRSVISTSDHSLSSQEKRNSGARTSMSSGHGRSQSLLSSTLNKLRGPSYLYYQASGDESNNDPSKNSTNSRESGTANGGPVEKIGGPTGKSQNERKLSDLEHPQQPFDFAFPAKQRIISTEPGPEIAPRARQPRPRKVENQSPGFDQEINVLKPPVGRRTQTESPQVLTRDTVMALVAAQERRSQTARAAQQSRSNTASDDQTTGLIKEPQNGGVGADRKNADSQNRRDQSPRTVATTTSSEQPSNKREGKVTQNSIQRDKLEGSDGHIPEDDEISVGTYASTIRPVSQNHEGSLMERRQQKHVHATVPEKLEVQPSFIAGKSVEDLITFEKDMPDTLQQPLQPRREVDYFASFSDPYLSPVPDLCSLNDGKLRSPRPPFSEESDGDSRHGSLRDQFRIDHTKQTVIANEREQRPAHITSPQPKETGRVSNEQKPKNSPATSTQYSDSDVPAFERLGLSSKVAKILVGTEAAGESAAHSQQTDPSRTTSERSSSSICDDSPPSPYSATTPDSSRPQSRKGLVLPQSESSQSESVLGSWSEAASTPNLEQQPTPTLTKVRGSVFSPSLVATPTSVSFADAMQNLDEEDEQDVNRQSVRPLPPRAQSALDLHSATKLLPRYSRPQQLQLKPNEVTSSVSLPSSPPPDLTEEVMPRKSALKMSRNNSANGPELSATISIGAAYLQEARKTAPIAATSSSRALRPHFPQKHSSGSIRSTVSAGNRAEPLAKMLVECCNCHFFHDMPSRVYECMAKPDSVVEDKTLGVSAAITTMVRCPWCAHGMTTQCCSGYAAVVYLKEKLHGR